MKLKKDRGMSLVEILVVITVFSVIGVLVARSVFLTLKGTAKSEANVKVRENLDYAMGVMERQIRSASSIVGCSADNLTVNYNDYGGNPTSFACVMGSGSYIASGSARLTSSDIAISACSFACTTATGGFSPTVTISVTGIDAVKTGNEGAQVTLSTTIVQRNY